MRYKAAGRSLIFVKILWLWFSLVDIKPQCGDCPSISDNLLFIIDTYIQVWGLSSATYSIKYLYQRLCIYKEHLILEMRHHWGEHLDCFELEIIQVDVGVLYRHHIRRKIWKYGHNQNGVDNRLKWVEKYFLESFFINENPKSV